MCLGCSRAGGCCGFFCVWVLFPLWLVPIEHVFLRWSSLKAKSYARKAPAEGKEFSAFLNNKRTGPGIMKWVQYLPAYHRHLSQFVGREVHIVEIGVLGGGSLEMWRAVFGQRAHVYGVDKAEWSQRFADNQTKIYIGDQASHEFWAKFRREVPRVDIIIDDGGHTFEQRLVAITEMLPHLAPNGVYMTEDIQGSADPFPAMMPALWPLWRSSPAFEGRSLSLHFYPFLLVLKTASSDADVARQLDAHAASRVLLTGVEGMNASSTSLDAVRGIVEAGAGKLNRTAFRDSDLKLDSSIWQRKPQELLIASFDEESSGQMLRVLVRLLADLHSEDPCCGNCETGILQRSCPESAVQRSISSWHFYPSFFAVRAAGVGHSAPRWIMRGSQWPTAVLREPQHWLRPLLDMRD